MSMVHRATGRSSKPGKADTNTNVTKSVKTETVKIAEKEKKQVRLQDVVDGSRARTLSTD